MFRQIIFYRTAKGYCPVEDFLDSLPGKDAQKMTWVLKLVEDLESVPTLYFKKLTDSDELWECRAKRGSNIHRIFAFMVGRKVILTHGLTKKTQKTPNRELERARNYRKEYMDRVGRIS